ncbi:CHASE3 domain-containing protein [Emticicia sp. 21SJ11W-3]|uniref:sensor histidine kinase n=1 Tax=Emticicia sp. 21SJ11W-3 TaxID=2916755 RepID=UPI00209E80D6|nr:sensor histidine kinase [Emticicia sp. 21SJ11W-3]UTA68321.1 CHASE3 domain-containing protein [Emticicia sp. 21SJ11W-3]
MKKSLRLILSSFIVCVILLATLSWLSYKKIKESTNYAIAVEDTHEVLRKSEELISVLKDYETGQRGYILTHERIFLEPYYKAENQISGIYRSLKFFVSKNELQSKRIDSLSGLISERIRLLKLNIAQVEKGQPIDKSTFLLGKKEMDDIRAVINRFQETERNLLDKRRDLKSVNDQQTSSILIMLSVFSFSLLIVCFFLIFVELRRRLKFQHKLENKIDELNRSNADLEQFAYVSSHDLQEPLRKIRSFSDRLVRKHAEALNEDGKETLEKITTAAERMQNLINDLLDFSRLVNRKEANFQNVNLQETLDKVLNDLSVKIEEKKADIITKKLPYIWGVSFQINQLFLNLISNALKFTSENRLPVIEIDYTIAKGAEIPGIEDLRKEFDYHKIVVKDNGIGFEAEYAEKIFVIFQRLHGRNHYEGTGVGLAICRRIMSNHNGFIFAESQPDEGATFILYFPTK